MPYPELMIRPMREDLTRIGIEEARTSEQVEQALEDKTGTLMVVVNSVCGCAAGKARPGIFMAMQNDAKPDRAITVFAGADIDATERAREYMTGVPPSSPAVALFKDGELVYMMHRRDIETRHAEEIAQELAGAFDRFCATDSVLAT